jgi:hypothetical protein
LICIYERLFCRHVKTFRENKLKIWFITRDVIGDKVELFRKPEK